MKQVLALFRCHPEHHRFGRRVEPDVANLLHHADHLALLKMLPNGFLVGPEFFYKTFIDHGNLTIAVQIRLLNLAAAQNGNTQRTEGARTHEGKADHRRIAVRRLVAFQVGHTLVVPVDWSAGKKLKPTPAARTPPAANRSTRASGSGLSAPCHQLPNFTMTPPNQEKASVAPAAPSAASRMPSLTHQRRPSRPERQARGHFLLPLKSTSEEQVGDIGARDEQHQNGRPAREPQETENVPTVERETQRAPPDGLEPHGGLKSARHREK